MRVLVVEDSIDLAEAVAELLRAAGHEPVVASPDTGDALDEFLARLQGEDADVALVDLGLGELEGGALVDALTVAPHAPAILLCTGAADALVAPYRDRVAGVLKKPFAFDDLVRAVESAGAPRERVDAPPAKRDSA